MTMMISNGPCGPNQRLQATAEAGLNSAPPRLIRER